MFNGDYYCIILEDKIYAQRTPNSKFIEFSLDGVKQNTYDELPFDIKKLVKTAEDMTQNPDKYFKYKEIKGEIEITSILNVELPYIKIPETINGLPVTRFGKYAGMDLRNTVEQIQLPNTLRYLNENTFSSLSLLKYINIPENVACIPDYCFANCYLLEQINLEHIKRIERNAFENCKELKQVNLENIEYLMPFCFQGCDFLEKINIYGPIKTIPVGGFEDCCSLNEVNLADNITAIQERAFRNCDIETFTAPKNLQTIAAFAFSNNNMRILNLNEKLENIYRAAFEGNFIQTINMFPNTKYHQEAFSSKRINIIEEER